MTLSTGQWIALAAGLYFGIGLPAAFGWWYWRRYRRHTRVPTQEEESPETRHTDMTTTQKPPSSPPGPDQPLHGQVFTHTLSPPSQGSDPSTASFTAPSASTGTGSNAAVCDWPQELRESRVISGGSGSGRSATDRRKRQTLPANIHGLAGRSDNSSDRRSSGSGSGSGRRSTAIGSSLPSGSTTTARLRSAQITTATRFNLASLPYGVPVHIQDGVVAVPQETGYPAAILLARKAREPSYSSWHSESMALSEEGVSRARLESQNEDGIGARLESLNEKPRKILAMPVPMPLSPPLSPPLAAPTADRPLPPAPTAPPAAPALLSRQALAVPSVTAVSAVSTTSSEWETASSLSQLPPAQLNDSTIPAVPAVPPAPTAPAVPAAPPIPAAPTRAMSPGAVSILKSALFAEPEEMEELASSPPRLRERVIVQNEEDAEVVRLELLPPQYRPEWGEAHSAASAASAHSARSARSAPSVSSAQG